MSGGDTTPPAEKHAEKVDLALHLIAKGTGYLGGAFIPGADRERMRDLAGKAFAEAEKVIRRQGFRLTVPIAQALLRGVAPAVYFQAKAGEPVPNLSAVLALIEEEVGSLGITVPSWAPPTEPTAPAATGRSTPVTLGAVTEYLERQGPHGYTLTREEYFEATANTAPVFDLPQPVPALTAIEGAA